MLFDNGFSGFECGVDTFICTAKKWLIVCSISVLFLVKISKHSEIRILLLDKQNDIRFLVLFPVGENLN